MIAADAGDRVAGAARHADMAELAMPDPARGLAVNDQPDADPGPNRDIGEIVERSEEHTSELQSLMRISYAVFYLKKKITKTGLSHTTIKYQHMIHRSYIT